LSGDDIVITGKEVNGFFDRRHAGFQDLKIMERFPIFAEIDAITLINDVSFGCAGLRRVEWMALALRSFGGNLANNRSRRSFLDI
jgi:hypothetical protein